MKRVYVIVRLSEKHTFEDNTIWSHTEIKAVFDDFDRAKAYVEKTAVPGYLENSTHEWDFGWNFDGTSYCHKIGGGFDSVYTEYRIEEHILEEA